jgi:hypothetical protein
MLRAEDDEAIDYDNVHYLPERKDLLFSMVDVKEETQISSQDEVGKIRTGSVVPTGIQWTKRSTSALVVASSF